MARNWIAKPWSFHFRHGEHSQIELVAHRETVSFRREVIPDGILAGQMGHLEIPGEEEVTFALDLWQARALRDQLNELLGGAR